MFHDLVHDLNTLLHAKSYRRAELLMDPAGFSGLISRTVAERLAKAARGLVMNRHHNGYPDLLVEGQYPNDSVDHGEGGMEVKASRYESGWQSHGPRAGWFTAVQFALDEREDVATYDLEPTRVRSVLVAELVEVDWAWATAKEGKIRSGTASVKARGAVKLRKGAVWVDADYRKRHEELLEQAKDTAFSEVAADLVLQELKAAQGSMKAKEAAAALAPTQNLSLKALESRVDGAFKRLKDKGIIEPSGRGFYQPATTPVA